ncbi:hypothetical protein [Candidatus Contubernalis alkaliaceticus]|uniref:hypothetical protein n=1 Tax=Candidatus Contubernalis alkaliaceticus TaxID=338645 RepID=UPI001F4BD619|nr:hypothetical protein [Candidatus Contubernalis alkalaceticus]UNC92883.1 hypothetical protein HUE98_12715 [Candidatus Contubernalis alkalaceticus]
MEQSAKLVQFLCLTCGLQGMKEYSAGEETETLLCSRCSSKVICTTKFSEGSIISNLSTAR